MPGVLNWGYYPAEDKWVPLRVDEDGSIHVVGYVDKLNDIGDVNVPAPADNDVLYWDAAASKWQSKANWVAAHKDTHDPQDGADPLDTAAPGSINENANAVGVAHSLARSDHNHQHIAALHESGGGAELSVAGLSGELADAQPPKAHKASHQDGGGDEISIAGLLGEPAELTTHKGLPNVHHTKTTDASELTAGELPTARLSTNIKTLSLTFIIDGGGSVITTNQKGHLEIPFACTIKRVTMMADVSGSIVVDIWKDTYAAFPPTNADSITAAAPPTISAAQKSQDSTLTGWTTAIAAGDILAFNVDSCATITRVTISLKVEKS